jgi:hypothetical protein
MTAYRGYKIEALTEQTFVGKDVAPVKTKTHRVVLGEKVIEINLQSVEAAKAAIDRRIKGRTRGGHEPVG